MGVLLLFLSLVSVGAVVDFLIENDLTADQSFTMFGATFRAPESGVVIIAAALGAVAVIFAVIGYRMLRRRRGHRVALKRRVKTLETENAQLRVRRSQADQTTESADIKQSV